MVKSMMLAGVAVTFAMAPCGASAQSNSLATDAAAFGVREASSNMDLSPDGRRVVYVGPGPGRYSLVFVADLATGDVKPILKTDGNPESMAWCGFVSSERIACRYHAVRRDSGILVGYGRMIALNVDGTEVKDLGQRSSSNDSRIRQVDGAIIDWLPGDGESVLMTRDFVPEVGMTDRINYRKADGIGVVKINVRTLKTETIEQPSTTISSYMSDGVGNVRLLSINETTPEGQLTGRTRYKYRTARSRDWETLVEYQEDEFIPLAIDASLDSLYALKKLNGRWALYRIKLDDNLAATLVASNPKVDIDDIVRIGDGQRVIGYSYVEDRRHVVYFDPEFKALTAALSRALPHAPLVDFVSASSDGQKILLFAGGDSDPGQYYLYNKSTKSMGVLLPARPDLAKRNLASVKAVTYSAPDGTQIPAYLTLPPGSSGKGLPAVVLPHGGPEARDEWNFDWLAQFLAARGYAVIQPNFRGSSGFGDSWLAENGFKGWRTSIGDVSAAAHWLSSQGIADPKRIAIVGWSYGGYAALQSAVTEPGLYKAIVAVAPVTDLGLFKADFNRYNARRLVTNLIGSGPHIEEGSPLRHADAVNAPVLLVHGDMDGNVDVNQSRRMDSALRQAGKASELIEFKGLDHQLSDNDARRQMLTKIGELLERTIGH